MKKRLLAALGANTLSQAVTILIQLVSVPVFLSIWSPDVYGQWLIIAAIPTYFALSDLGFIAVITNKMTMVAAKGDNDQVEMLLQTGLKLCVAAIVMSTLLVGVGAALIDARPLDVWSHKLALGLLVVSALLAMSGGLVDAVFRSQGDFATGTHLINGSRVLEWGGLLLGLAATKSFLGAAIGQLLGRLVGSLTSWRIATSAHPAIRWGIGRANRAEFRSLLQPAGAFMAFPIGNALSIQGLTLLVGHLYGGAFLAVFNTYRTLSRVLVQVVAVIGRSLWPEISSRFGAGDRAMVSKLYWRGSLVSMLIAGVGCLILAGIGATLIEIWTSGRLPFQKGLFYGFLLATVVTSVWQMGMVVLSATNCHGGFSWAYLAGSTLPIVLTYAFHEEWGVYATAMGLVGFELFVLAVTLVYMRSFFRSGSHWA